MPGVLARGLAAQGKSKELGPGQLAVVTRLSFNSYQIDQNLDAQDSLASPPQSTDLQPKPPALLSPSRASREQKSLLWVLWCPPARASQNQD